MERLCVRVQQQVCALRGVGEMEEIQAAKQVVKEARNSRAVSGCETYERSNCIAVKQNFELCYFSPLQAVPFSLRAGSRPLCRWAGATEAGLTGW